MYGNRQPPQTPPCERCRVDLREDNQPAAKIYQLVKNQVLVAGMGSVLGLNHLAVWEAIDRYRIDRPLECFEKVLVLDSAMRDKERE